MALTLEQKRQVVSEVAEVASRAHSVIAAEYRGLPVAKLTEFRVKAREAGAYVRVVRNTLARRALQGTNFECMSNELTGPLILAFGVEDPGGVARVMRDFAKREDKLVVRLVSFGGRLLAAKDIDRLASVPTREEALARLAFVLKAPITQLVRTMAEPQARLVRALSAVAERKRAA